MKVFVAGATGALGKQLVPRLVAAGHDVVGMTRSEQRADLVRELGAEPAIADALDPDAVGAAVSAARPEVIVHQLTALSGSLDLRHMDRSFAQTNRLRTEGTDILLSAARAAGTRRFVAQSFAGWPAERTGGPVKTEDDPPDPDPPVAVRTLVEAILYLERAVVGAAPIEGLALRYGGFYGPGTSFQFDPPAGEQTEAIRDRKFPIVGGGTGILSFIHIEDAAEATAIAIERGAPGVYNVVDDNPTPVRDWLPEAARELGAKKPFRVPRWLGRLLAGEAATVMMTELRGASNAKAKRELGWVPAHPSLVGALAGGTA
jgi:nucleoside-diphosphate-sugar epimerase